MRQILKYESKFKNLTLSSMAYENFDSIATFLHKLSYHQGETAMKRSAVQQWLDLQFGLFIHFGLYSILAGAWKGKPITRGYSEQILSHGYLPQTDYEALINQFSLPKFDPEHIVSVAKEAGMQYMVITTKHHDGFCLYDTKTTDYKSTKAACKRDIVRELSEECQKQGLRFGIYFSWIDCHFAHALPISSHNSDAIPELHQQLNIAQLTELLTNYGPICELWMDMGAPTVQQSQEVYDLVQKLQPMCMVNGRIWNDRQDFLTMGDNELPSVALDCPWQTPASIYKETWGYREWQERGDKDQKILELTETARKVVSEGGNYLLNIGLVGDGSIQEFEEKVLKGIGRNLKKMGLYRRAKEYEIPTFSMHTDEILCSEAFVFYRYAGSDYYTYAPIPTSLHWRLELKEDTTLRIEWKTEVPIAHQQKLCLEVGSIKLFSSLQQGRTKDTMVSSLALNKGVHHLCLHTVGDPLVRPEIIDTNIALVVRKDM